MKKHWQKITIVLLGIALIASVTYCVLLNNQVNTLKSEYERVQQTLVNQTNLIVELRRAPKNFDNLDELTQWVSMWEAENKPIVIAILDHTFVIAGNDELYSQYWDCDDISEAMQRDALKDKYLIDRVLVSVGGVTLDHAVCQAVAGNIFYFIEPQTGEITTIGERD